MKAAATKGACRVLNWLIEPMRMRFLHTTIMALSMVSGLHAQVDRIAIPKETIERLPVVDESALSQYANVAGHWVQRRVDSIALHYAATITVDELREHLTILASDAYMGRDTGKEGQKMAAAYLKKEFQAMGIPPLDRPGVEEGYFQVFDLVEEQIGGLTVKAPDIELRFPDQLLYFSERPITEQRINRLVYMERGSKLTDAKGLKGEVVVINDPGIEEADIGPFMQQLSRTASSAGVAAVFVATERLARLHEAFGHYVSGGRMRLKDDNGQTRGREGPQLMFVDEAALDRLLGKWSMDKFRKRKPGRQAPVDMVLHRDTKKDLVQSENVLAFIEGSDKKNEVLVITAHYDHVGVENGEVYNGADDDGSGTVAIMEIAEAFAMAKAVGHGPRRSVLVMPVSAEEKGLLGSRYYSENPVFPLESTIANLNIDMIGRRDSTHADSAPYVYVIGSDRLSTDLHAANETANTENVGLMLDYTFNAEDDPNRFYYRSDHYNFARKGVPAIFYFSGVHEDYHKPGDDVEKIEFGLLQQRTLLVFHTAWILANTEQRPVVDKAE